jgi:hypothetical protein
MPAHLKRRGDIYYIIDGPITRSLKTTERPLANHLLKQYLKGKYGLQPTPRVGDFYRGWIEKKIEPLYRRSQVRDYRQHFHHDILPRFKDTRLSALVRAISWPFVSSYFAEG